MKLQGAAEDILITAVSYSLWNGKLFVVGFFLFVCGGIFGTKPFTLKHHKKNLKDLQDHVQQQQYFITQLFQDVLMVSQLGKCSLDFYSYLLLEMSQT